MATARSRPAGQDGSLLDALDNLENGRGLSLASRRAAAAGKHLCQAMLSLGVKDPVVLRAHCPGAEDGATCAYCFASGPECDQCTVCMCACGSATPYVLIPDGQVIIHPRRAQSSLRAHNPLSSSHFPLPENIRSLLLFSLL